MAGSSARTTGIFTWPFSGRFPRVAVLLGLAILVVGLLYVGWRQYGKIVLSDARFQLTKESIEVTPLPAWIRTDLVAEVMRDGSLDKTSLLDQQLTVQVAQAFAMHSWVESVKHVSKHPDGRLRVALEYRRPVAMVEVEGGLWPVDAHGVLLPTQDFSKTEAIAFPRIAAGQTRPQGFPGIPWGDKSVIGAAKIAAAFGGLWKQLGLYRINAQVPGSQGFDPAKPTYDLYTRQGTRIYWGQGPREGDTGASSAAGKVAWLADYVKTHGPLDQHTGRVIDLRQARE